MSSSCCEHDCRAPDTDLGYRRILWVALGINLSMFLVEIIASFLAESVSLRADALDFLGDSLTYGMSLAVIGAAVRVRAALPVGRLLGCQPGPEQRHRGGRVAGGDALRPDGPQRVREPHVGDVDLAGHAVTA